ncbi:hypothetical protein AAE478_005756 [Parahypoxylon ruwenzoriense]
MTGRHTKMECAAPSCKSRKDSSGPVASKFCKKHTCAHFYSRSPPGPRCDNWKYPSDSVCPNHTCQRCDSIVEGNSVFCHTHNLCEVPGCDRPRTNMNGLCQSHLKCSIPTCQVPKANDSLFCLNHTCGERGCRKPNGNHSYLAAAQVASALKDAYIVRIVRALHLLERLVRFADGILLPDACSWPPDQDTDYKTKCEEAVRAELGDDKERLVFELQQKENSILEQYRQLQQRDERIRELERR